ncbi:hypothetical protein [Rothia nasimurium]|uniref:hypothetical protein n=1 Tax=Rothia nasimurium TaxID=85336 RepID=UPI001F425F6E|nr:hypothetical protein [Rothia nasimurium]
MLGVLVIFYLSPYVKNKWWAAMGGGVIVFGGIGQQEVLGNITNLRWFLDIGATIALLGFYKNSIGIILASFFVIGGATSDPLALALLPVAIWRLCVLPGCGKIIPSLYLLSSAIHWIIIESSARQSILIDLIKQPMNTIEFIATRAFGVALFGETGTQAGVLVFNVGLIGFIAVIIFGIIYNISRPFIHRGVKIQLFLLVSASICFLLATVAFSATELVDVGRDLLYVSRYSLIPAIFLALFLIICLSWIPLRGYKRYLVYGTVAMLGIAAIVDSRGDEWATRGPVWSETVKVARQQCEQDKDLYSVTVPITPQNVPTKWEATLTCDWLLK